jgi:hypothetical protein
MVQIRSTSLFPDVPGDRMPSVSRVVLTLPADPSFLRLARLAAADAGARAGFNFEEIDDLRIGLDELCGRLFDGVGTATITFEVSDGCVAARGEASNVTSLEPSDISQAIVEAVVDEHSFGNSDGRAWFELVKQGTDSAEE